MMKKAIIVGGSRGIGFAIARKFLKNGIDVTLVSRNENNLKTSVDTLKQDSIIQAVVNYDRCDITNEDDIVKCCQKVISEAVQEKRSIDILVNSAGITHNKLLITDSSQSIRHVLDTNLLGTMLFTRSIVKHMIRQKRGSIITIGSIIGSNGNVGQTAYAASKAGLVGFTKSLAKEIGPKGIAVNLIAPGFIETDMTAESLSAEQMKEIEQNIPLRRIGFPDDVAEVAHFLASSSTYITGQVFNVDGGLSLTF